MKKIKTIVTDILLIALSLFLAIGVLTIFSPCGPKEDGSYMNCHWAGLVIAALGAVLFIQAVAHLFFKNSGVKLGISAAMLPMAVLTACIPNTLIKMCMMSDMRCRAIMQPSVMVICVILIIIAVIDIVIEALNIKRESNK